MLVAKLEPGSSWPACRCDHDLPASPQETALTVPNRACVHRSFSLIASTLYLTVALTSASCSDKVVAPPGTATATDLGAGDDAKTPVDTAAIDSTGDVGVSETLPGDAADVPDGAVQPDAADVQGVDADALADADATAPEDDADVQDVAKILADGTDAADTLPTSCPGAADCACVTDLECGGGLCAEHKDGTRTCAAPCGPSSTCPAGLTCNSVGGKDLCVEGDLRLCDPCVADKDCQVPGGSGALCVTVPGQGHFCGVDCINDKNCPLGYKCLDALALDKSTAKQCLPAGGAVCNCTPLAVTKKLKTACSQDNAAGSCAGERACVAKGEPGAPEGGGLSACSAQVPAAETCNGVDDDCDGTIDGNASCDDGNPCTSDTCAGQAGCTHEASTGGCDDGNACTEGDVCAASTCKGKLLICDDKNPCTVDSCDVLKGCTYAVDGGASCDDGNACTKDSCALGLCSQTTITCDDGNPCTTDACDPAAGCTATANDAGTCSDENACTTDTCVSGKCISKTNAPCDDGDKCTADGCDPDKGCTALPLPAGSCDDKNACTTDTCDPAIGCKHAAIPGCSGGLPYSQAFNCGDTSLATWKLSAAVGGVGWAFDGTPSSPGFKSPACSLNYNNGSTFDSASANSGTATTPEIDATAAKTGAPLQLSFVAAGSGEGGFSYDKLYVQGSTDNLTWASLTPVPGNSNLTVPAYGATWTKTTVDLKTYAGKKFRIRFLFDTVDSVANSGTGPFIDDLLIADLSCSSDSQCDDKNGCTKDTCDGTTGQCKATTITATCDDGNACTTGDTCASGGCAGTVKVCDDKNPCTKDSCDSKTGSCVATALPDGQACSDGDACTIGDACIAAQCVSVPKCNDGNPCTADVCNPATLACTTVNLPDGATCTDLDACTASDVCGAGKCAGTPGSACSALVEDAFGCGEVGTWALSPAVAATQTGWQIDASPSPPAWHSPSCSLNFNNGATLACASGGTSVAGSATSPVYDASGASDAVLEFYSYADVGTNLFVNKRWVEASKDDFQTLAFVAALPNEATVSKAWVLYKFNAKALAGQTFKVRFRFDSMTCAATTGQGWFVDDLRITTNLVKACTTDANCADSNACSDNTCVNGQCALAWNATACDDGNACTTGDKCNGAGVCKPGTAVTCNDNNGCTADSCNPVTGCVFANTDGVGCTDGNDCTSGDACKAGKCAPTGSSANGTPCSDGEVCTAPDVCTSGKCGGKNACDDGNACTIDACTKSQQGTKVCSLVPVAENSPCDDGNACTAGDTCLAGKCASYQVCGGGGLDDGFPCGSNGSWTFEAPAGNGVAWKIDGLPTPLFGGVNAWQSPSCSLNFNNDDSFDSGTLSNGKATSAPVTISATGPATLEFWSYFDTETGGYYDQRYVDLLDPVTGSVLLTFAESSSTDYAGLQKWTQVKHDIPSNLLGAKVQIRFRFLTLDNIGNSGAGWFIDDLKLLPGSSPCKADVDCKDDGNPCTDAVCVAGACSQTPGSAGKTCDDGNPCTTASACGGGLCKGSAVVTCDDGYACTTDSCDPAKGCVYTPVSAGTCGIVGLPYVQGFACGDVSNQLWQLDLAAQGPVWAMDATPAVPGFQSPGCALNFNDGQDTACASGQTAIDASAKSPTFDASALKPATPLTLQFSLAGTWDVAGSSLDLDLSLDGKAWTTLKSYGAQDTWAKFTVNLGGYAGKKFQLRFHYSAQTCTGLVPGSGPFIDDFKLYSPTCMADSDCADTNPCTADTCDGGLCLFTAKSGTCDDGNACTSGDGCAGGQCGGILQACDDGNACTTDSCDTVSGACVFVAKDNGIPCTDGNPCTTTDACSQGKCVGGGVSVDGTKCSDGNACTTGDACTGGKCTPASNTADGTLCSDGDPCTTSDGCSGGKCAAGKPACDDGNPCTSDACTALDATSKTCASSPVTDGTPCDDGNACTTSDACTQGACTGVLSCK
jgi:hypothetical protein